MPSPGNLAGERGRHVAMPQLVVFQIERAKPPESSLVIWVQEVTAFVAESVICDMAQHNVTTSQVGRRREAIVM